MISTTQPSVHRHRHVGLNALVITTLAVGIPTSAASADQNANHSRRPSRVAHAAPIEAALNLLNWPSDQVPTIVVVAERPPEVDALAEGWVVGGAAGTPTRTIYIAGWSSLYREAASDRVSPHTLIRLAGVLAHERTHLEHGPDEEEAYFAQVLTLERLQAPAIDRANVFRSLDMIRRQQRRRR